MSTIETRIEKAIEIVETQWSLTEEDRDELKYLLEQYKLSLNKKSTKKSGK